jgi:hypothetical protein
MTLINKKIDPCQKFAKRRYAPAAAGACTGAHLLRMAAYA